MRNLTVLPLLALAAVASAQTKSVDVRLAGAQGFTKGNGTGYVPTDRLATAAYASSKVQSYWKAAFDLSDVPADSRILSARLDTRINDQLHPNTEGVAYVYAYEGTGTLTTTPLGGNHLPIASYGGGVYVGTVVSIDATAFLNSLAGRYAEFEFFEGIKPGVDRLPLYWATPKLTVTYAPVPEPAPLVALGAGVLALLRRRRR